MLARCFVRSGARPSLRALRAPALLGALLLVLVPPGGCTVQPTTGVDTCNQGVTFQEPHLVSFGVDASGVATMALAWSPGTERGQELPQDYFAAVRAEGAVSAALTATNQITVVLGDLSERLAVSTMVRVMLLFPDRADHIDCVHPGMADQYLLHIVLHFDDAGMLQQTELTEELVYGDI